MLFKFVFGDGGATTKRLVEPTKSVRFARRDIGAKLLVKRSGRLLGRKQIGAGDFKVHLDLGFMWFNCSKVILLRIWVTFHVEMPTMINFHS